jgi:hypothetical protein
MRPWYWGFAAPVVVAASALLAGCKGDIGGEDPGKVPETDPEAACTPDASLEVPLQRINVTQFRRVIAELFGDDLVYDDAFPVPLQGYAYSTFSAANPVADAQVKPIMETAEAIAMQVADRIPACSGDETACATEYLTTLATRALRRAPADEETAILVGLYTGARAEMDYAESVAVAVSGLLQMPQFLYLFEEAPAAGSDPTTLDGQEIAQRMALLYWNGLPDEALLAKADSGALADAEERRNEALRMLADPKARAALSGFLREWMMVQGFRATIHETALQDALDEELTRNIDDALASEDGLRALLTSNRTYVNSTLETFYGLPATSSGPDDWKQVDLDPEVRVGILSHPVLMARFAHGEAPSDILRGKFVRVNLLCFDIEPPPPGAQEEQNELTPQGSTIREQAQARLDHQVCGGCHRMMDPIGFGFSAFDGAGRYLPGTGAQVDTTGNIQPPSDLSGEFHGVRELGERLAGGTEVQTCFAKQWIRYTLGKRESVAEECSIDAIAESMTEQSLSMTDLFAGVAATRAFVTRADSEEN